MNNKLTECKKCIHAYRSILFKNKKNINRPAIKLFDTNVDKNDEANKSSYEYLRYSYSKIKILSEYKFFDIIGELFTDKEVYMNNEPISDVNSFALFKNNKINTIDDIQNMTGFEKKYLSKTLFYFYLMYGCDPDRRPNSTINDREYNVWLGNYDEKFNKLSENANFDKLIDSMIKYHKSSKMLDTNDVNYNTIHELNKIHHDTFGICNIFLGCYKNGKYIVSDDNIIDELFFGKKHECKNCEFDVDNAQFKFVDEPYKYNINMEAYYVNTLKLEQLCGNIDLYDLEQQEIIKSIFKFFRIIYDEKIDAMIKTISEMKLLKSALFDYEHYLVGIIDSKTEAEIRISKSNLISKRYDIESRTIDRAFLDNLTQKCVESCEINKVNDEELLQFLIDTIRSEEYLVTQIAKIREEIEKINPNNKLEKDMIELMNKIQTMCQKNGHNKIIA